MEMWNWASGNQSTRVVACQDQRRIYAVLYRLITIYDVKIELQWEGTASDGTDVSGTLTIPEVSHEVTLDGLSDYVVRSIHAWSNTARC